MGNQLPSSQPCARTLPRTCRCEAVTAGVFFRKDVNSRCFMFDPPPPLDETHILPKSGHLVSTERHLCSKTPCFTVCAFIFLVKIGKLSHSRTKRLVSALPKSALFTVGALVFRQMCSTLAHTGHFGPISKSPDIYSGCALCC